MKVEITYPDNLNEISVGQYQKYVMVTENIDGEFLYQRTVEVLCNIPFERVTYLKRKDVKFIAEHLHNLLNSDVEFKHRFKIKDQEFGFIPSFEDISSGEFADLSAYISETKNLHKAMAVLFRPIVKTFKDKYKLVDYTGTSEYSDLMKYMPLGIAFGAMVFFWSLTNDLIKGTKHSIRQEAIQVISERFPTLAENGAFTKISTPLLKEILQSLTK
tara:strand:+ start:2119 stop:2766 length:648 start_codon:yes stop_codon:yes gene_type:complete